MFAMWMLVFGIGMLAQVGCCVWLSNQQHWCSPTLDPKKNDDEVQPGEGEVTAPLIKPATTLHNSEPPPQITIEIHSPVKDGETDWEEV